MDYLLELGVTYYVGESLIVISSVIAIATRNKSFHAAFVLALLTFLVFQGFLFYGTPGVLLRSTESLATWLKRSRALADRHHVGDLPATVGLCGGVPGATNRSPRAEMLHQLFLKQIAY